MLAWIQRFLAAPAFESEDKTRTASLLNVISLALLVVAAGATAASFIQEFSLVSLMAGAAVVLMELGVQFLMRRGRVRFASLAQSSLLWVMVTYLNVVSGGVRASTFSSYVLVILMAGLLSGSYVGMGAAGLSVVAGLVMLYAEARGFLLFTEVTPDSEMVTQTAHFVLVAVMVHIAVRGIHSALERARSTNRELESAQASLQERIQVEQKQREQLRDANEEIEARVVSEQEKRESLQRILEQIHGAAADLDSAAGEILAATTQQASGATEQASAISQTTTTVDEVKTIAEQSVSRAQQVVDVAQRTVEVSHTGQQAVQDTIDSMTRIKTRVEVIAENILALSEQTQQIGAIIDAVNDIASQSNMLALNAAVEAARAGDHGKGFAVVAEEVRDLAERSRQATAQIKAILSDIQGATNATVIATEEGTKDVDQGAQLAAQAQMAIAQLAQVIDESAQMAMQMSAGGQQQATGVEQIAHAMQNINQSTVQSLSSTRQTERSAQQLNDLARSLTQIVEQYQV